MDFRTEWNKSVVRVGRVTMLLAICCSFLPNKIFSSLLCKRLLHRSDENILPHLRRKHAFKGYGFNDIR